MTQNSNGKFILILIQKKLHIDFVATLVLHYISLSVHEKNNDNELEEIIISTEITLPSDKNDKIQRDCKFSI